MPKFNQGVGRRHVMRKGEQVTLRTTAVTPDPNSDWGDEIETTTEEQVIGLVQSAGALPGEMWSAEGVEIDAEYIIYVRDDITSTLYDDDSPNHAASVFIVNGTEFSLTAAPPTSNNGVYRCPVERV